MLEPLLDFPLENDWTFDLSAGKQPEGNCFVFSGVGGGVRTHDHWNHNPALYQLSYTHRVDLLILPNPAPSFPNL